MDALGTHGGAPSWPSPTTIMGAMAMMGMVCDAITKGSSPPPCHTEVHKEHRKEKARDRAHNEARERLQPGVEHIVQEHLPGRSFGRGPKERLHDLAQVGSL